MEKGGEGFMPFKPGQRIVPVMPGLEDAVRRIVREELAAQKVNIDCSSVTPDSLKDYIMQIVERHKRDGV